MKTKTYIGLIILMVVLLSGCIEEKPTGNQTINETEKILVATTIIPEKNFIEKIGKDKVEVLVMVPLNANPHIYEPTPKQMEKLSNAKIYFMVGSGIEFELGWMDKLKEINKNMKVVNTSEGINLIKSEDPDEPGMDPHVWTSPKNAKIMVNNILNALIEIDPKNKEYYENNAKNYINELDSLDNEISKIFEKTKNKKFIIHHPAFGYLAKDYGLEQISIEYEGKEISPKWIEEVIKKAKEENIKIVFVSPQFDKKTAELIAKEINGKVVNVDPLAENYIESIRKFAESFSDN